MSVSRLLRAQRLAKRSAAPLTPPIDEHIAAVMAANALRPPPVWDPLPPLEPQPPVPAAPPAAEPKPAPATAEPPPPAPPRAWHDDYCRWRQRTAADDHEDAQEANENDEDDDPLGIYS